MRRERRTRVRRPGRVWPFLFGIAVGAAGTWTFGARETVAAPEVVAPSASPKRTHSTNDASAAPPTRSASRRNVRRPIVDPEPVTPSGGALAALLSMTPQLSKCLAGIQGSMPTWLEVDARGAIRSVRFERGLTPEATACAERLLVGREVGSGRAETLYVEFSAP